MFYDLFMVRTWALDPFHSPAKRFPIFSFVIKLQINELHGRSILFLHVIDHFWEAFLHIVQIVHVPAGI